MKKEAIATHWLDFNILRVSKELCNVHLKKLWFDFNIFYNLATTRLTFFNFHFIYRFLKLAANIFSQTKLRPTKKIKHILYTPKTVLSLLK